jgi:hypothetical protein
LDGGDAAGGSLELGELLTEHGAAVVSDLSEFHHIDLVSALRDHTHSPRMLLARIANLPDSGALAASFQGVPRGWGGDRHALVTITDAIQQNTYVTARAGGSKMRKPKPIERPRAKRNRVTVTVADLLNAQAQRTDSKGG